MLVQVLMQVHDKRGEDRETVYGNLSLVGHSAHRVQRRFETKLKLKYPVLASNLRQGTKRTRATPRQASNKAEHLRTALVFPAVRTGYSRSPTAAVHMMAAQLVACICSRLIATRVSGRMHTSQRSPSDPHWWCVKCQDASTNAT